MTWPPLCRVLPRLATWGRTYPACCPKLLESMPDTSVYVCITGLVRWAGKYIAKDDYTTSLGFIRTSIMFTCLTRDCSSGKYLRMRSYILSNTHTWFSSFEVCDSSLQESPSSELTNHFLYWYWNI